MISARIPGTWRRISGVAATLPTVAILAVAASSGHPASAAPASAGSAQATAAQWTGTWAASPQKPERPGFANVTLRLIVHTTIGGNAARIRLSNEFGTRPLRIGAASVGLAAAGAAVVPGTLHPLTFHGGQPGATIAPGSQILSDGVAGTIPPNSNLAVSLYLPTATGAPTEHANGGDSSQTSYISASGNQTEDAGLQYTKTTNSWFFLDGVDVDAPGTSAVVALGDSLTDGVYSTDNTDTRYPNWLYDRLQSAGGQYAGLSVLDAGIGGNELLRTSACCGASPSALSRLDTDALDQSGVRDVIALLGTNDILGAHHAGSAEVIDGLRQLISRVHARGLRIFGGTIPPSREFSAAENQTRLAVNRWITSSGAYDGVFDFASAVADPVDSAELNPAYDANTDGLHPNSLGYQAMADAVNITDLRGYTYDDRSLDYSGPWTHAGASLHYTHGDYQQTEANSDRPNASVSLAFHGTGVEWVGPRGANSGIADVYLDGKQVATVDTYDPVTKLFQQDLYQAQGLAPGRHILTIKPAGTKNPLSAGTGIAIDAIKVTG
ncbi:MAG: GDSL-type esterase/lipase family protein [Streptosporangiales bacterium]|nr:GDSL-type esterase/lipase family protein [Streptosporangiales bacterium]